MSGVSTSTAVCRPHFHAPLHPWLSDGSKAPAWCNPFGNESDNKPPSPLITTNHHNLFSFPPTPPKDATPDSVTTNSTTNHTTTSSTTSSSEYQQKGDFNKSESAFATKTTNSGDYSQKNMDGFGPNGNKSSSEYMHKNDYLAHAAALNAVAFMQHDGLDVKPGINMLGNGILSGTASANSKHREGIDGSVRSPGNDSTSSNSESEGSINPKVSPCQGQGGHSPSGQGTCFPPPPPLQPSPYHEHGNYYSHYHHHHGNLFKSSHHHSPAGISNSSATGLHSNLKNNTRNKSRSSAGKKLAFLFCFAFFDYFFFNHKPDQICQISFRAPLSNHRGHSSDWNPGGSNKVRSCPWEAQATYKKRNKFRSERINQTINQKTRRTDRHFTKSLA